LSFYTGSHFATIVEFISHSTRSAWGTLKALGKIIPCNALINPGKILNEKNLYVKLFGAAVLCA